MPVFSPDGQTVAFFQQGQLKKVAVNGGGPVKICDLGSAPFGASWGRDQQILLGTQQGVVRVDARGGTPELLFPSSEWYPTGFNPQSLPGGEWVLYMVPATRDELPDEWRVVVRSRTSGEREVVVDGARFAAFVAGPSGLRTRQHVVCGALRPAHGTRARRSSAGPRRRRQCGGYFDAVCRVVDRHARVHFPRPPATSARPAWSSSRAAVSHRH